jgi:DNA-binding GntR family transcriptional regulator
VPVQDRDITQAPPTIASYVLNTIRDGILAGRYPLGSRLDQQMLADEMSVSVIPIRESLRQLEAEGLVQIYPRRGAFVAKLSASELKEIYEIRQVLEGLATQLAVPNLSPSALAQLARIVERMERATTAHDFGRLLELNRSFHFTIYQASRRPFLLQMISSLWDRCSLYRRLYIYLPERAPQALAEHTEIYAACWAGNAAAAGQAVRENIQQTVEGILEKLKADGLLDDLEESLVERSQEREPG